ncbi:MAG: DUF2177 family protein [Hyphomicrobiaceae bacterium]
MKTFAAAYLSAALSMLILDAVWLSTMAPILYRPLLQDLLAESFSLAPAVAFYLLYVTGITVLAVLPAIDTGRWTTAAFYGCVLGIVAYGTYDLTNQATLRVWPVVITVIDLCWGAFLTSITAVAGYCGARLVRS